MCQLIETIQCINRVAQNLSYHQRRVNRSQSLLWDTFCDIDLCHELAKYEIPDGLVRCRIVYAKTIETVEFFDYKLRNIQSLKLVYDNTIDYNLKFNNRDKLNELALKKGECDEVIIVKNGLITDTTFTNICFFDGLRWFTPATPLLRGTKRELLLEKGIIHEAEIVPGDLSRYSKVMLINAMLDFDESRSIDMRIM